MEKCTPTVMKSLLQICQGARITYPVYSNSTFNQKLNIQAAAELESDEYPSWGYFMIGIGGIGRETGADGFEYTVQYTHAPTDTGLFKELPFVVRPVTSDLEPFERTRYRLRKLITIDGVSYFAYYARVIEYPESEALLNKRSVQKDGSVTQTPFSPTESDLSPTPKTLTSKDTVVVTAKYAGAFLLVDIVLTEQDITEILNASLIVYGREDHAVISELAICSGADRFISSSAGGATTEYTEAIAVQAMGYLSTNFPAPSWRTGCKFTFDFGNSIPLLETTTEEG